ncbi:MAG: preprotein translocase subunit SecE [Methylocystaceae bacterium]
MAANAKKDKVTLKDRWLWLKEYVSYTSNELKKVHWPTRNQLIGYTAVVLFTVLLVSMIIWVFDSTLGKGMELLFKAVGK